ncbi:flavodoxin, partial [Staphylococcus chromogenes]
HVLKYPLNLAGIYKISTYHLDNINRSKNTNENNNKKINQITRKVIKKLGL